MKLDKIENPLESLTVMKPYKVPLSGEGGSVVACSKSFVQLVFPKVSFIMISSS